MKKSRKESIKKTIVSIAQWLKNAFLIGLIVVGIMGFFGGVSMAFQGFFATFIAEIDRGIPSITPAQEGLVGIGGIAIGAFLVWGILKGREKKLW